MSGLLAEYCIYIGIRQYATACLLTLQAARAYDAEALQLLGPAACLNFPQGQAGAQHQPQAQPLLLSAAAGGSRPPSAASAVSTVNLAAALSAAGAAITPESTPSVGLQLPAMPVVSEVRLWTLR